MHPRRYETCDSSPQAKEAGDVKFSLSEVILLNPQTADRETLSSPQSKITSKTQTHLPLMAESRPLFSVTGMRLLHWCMLGVGFLLLASQVIISLLCESLIVLVDGFHTIFILVRMALSPPQPAIKPPVSSLDSSESPPAPSSSSTAAPPSPLPADPSSEALTGTNITNVGSLIPDQAPTPPRAEPEGGLSSEVSSASLSSGLSYSSSRTQPVGAFISSLVLASLCLSCITDIIDSSLEPHPVQRPLLPVLVAAASLLFKLLVIWLNWGLLQDEPASSIETLENESHLEVNHKANEEAEGWSSPGRVLNYKDKSVADAPLHNAALILSNPGAASDLPDTDSRLKPQPGVHLPAAATEDRGKCEELSCVEGSKHSNDMTEIATDNNCAGHQDIQPSSNSSPVHDSSHHTNMPVRTSSLLTCLLPSLVLIQSLCSPILALINSLVTLLISLHCVQVSGACGLLFYLDPGLSMLAVIVLIATAMPQVHRYGLLLLQSTPPHISVCDLGRRIKSVPGVQAFHELHVWQLTGSLTVASVHVHCHAGFPVNRCADVMSGVTKVLQSVGVSCCTVQPEFVSCSASSSGSSSDASLVIHREDPTQPPLLLSCSLACGKVCAGHMCCSPPEEESRSLRAPPAGETKEDPQTMVIENTFL